VSTLRRLARPVTRPLRAALRRAGYDVVPVRQDALSSANIRSRWIERLGIDLVVDVGANEGQFVGWMRDRGYAGRILSFEPQAAAFRACQRRWGGDAGWAGLQLALGEAPGRLEMQVAGNSVSSSLLPMMHSHVAALPESAVVTTETVEVARLDAAIAPHLDGARRLFLKVDTQGYELPVLRGAAGILDRVAFLEIELSLVPLYEGQSLLPETVQAIQRLGFTPVWLEQGFSDERALRMLQMDGLFVRDGLLEQPAPGHAGPR
jgi:FkbM family methyltransferase